LTDLSEDENIDIDIDHRFPLCLEQIQENNNLNLHGYHHKHKYFYFFDSPSLEHKSIWYVLDLLLHIFLYDMTAVYGVAFLTWYYVFIVQRFGTSLATASYMTIVCAIVFATLSFTTPGNLSGAE
jgi:hypothetical protein